MIPGTGMFLARYLWVECSMPLRSRLRHNCIELVNDCGKGIRQGLMTIRSSMSTGKDFLPADEALSGVSSYFCGKANQSGQGGGLNPVKGRNLVLLK